jgi:hypothetical protein
VARGLDGKAGAAFCSTSLDHSASALGFHANQKTVRALPLGHRRLVSAFHFKPLYEFFRKSAITIWTGVSVKSIFLTFPAFIAFIRSTTVISQNYANPPHPFKNVIKPVASHRSAHFFLWITFLSESKMPTSRPLNP